jgi:hypothetical protein
MIKFSYLISYPALLKCNGAVNAISNDEQVGQVTYSAVGLWQMESLLHDILVKAGLGDLSGLHSK